MIRRLLCWFLLLLLVACKKEKHIILMKGRLLQSSSNPVPVDNNKLTFYQNGSSGAPIDIGSSSASADCITNKNGIFQCSFILDTSTFPVINSPSKNSIFMSGRTTTTEFHLFSLTYRHQIQIYTLFIYINWFIKLS